MSTPWWTILTAWEWAAVGPCVVGIGLMIAWFAGDRSRGRKRCPKCWYDMSGAVLAASEDGVLCRCPECGRGVQSARELGRNRRSTAKGCVGAILLVLAYALLATPRVVISGWKGAIPTAGLIVGMWIAPRQPNITLPARDGADEGVVRPLRVGTLHAVCEMFVARSKAGEVWSWQRAFAARVATHRIDRQLDQWPPRYDDALERLIESYWNLSTGQGATEIAPLVSVQFKFARHTPVGSPCYAIVQSVGLGREDVEAEITTDWPGAKPVTVSMLSPRGRIVLMLSSFGGYAIDDGVCLGVPSVADSVTNLTVTIRRPSLGTLRTETHEISPVVSTRRYQVPLCVVQSSAAQLLPIVSAEADRRVRAIRAYFPTPAVSDGRVTVELSCMDVLASEDPLLIGVRVQLLHDDQVVDEVPACLNPTQEVRYPWLSKHGFVRASVRVHFTRPIDKDQAVDSEGWSIRLIGDQDAARMDIKATSYWVGEVTIPLEQLNLR